MAFERVVAASNFWDGDMHGFVVRGRRVVLVRIGGQFFAYEDRCAHLGLPLSDGQLVNGVIVCRAHRYEYDACTGRGLNPRSVCLRCYRVAQDGDWVSVDVTEVT
jgi:toluene monooxygenase system ferredoxin subunit